MLGASVTLKKAQIHVCPHLDRFSMNPQTSEYR